MSERSETINIQYSIFNIHFRFCRVGHFTILFIEWTHKRKNSHYISMIR
ncbi:hypothetical protein D1AOALGA4SA_480 [Olavius algarvensis Delta 1 endosymbiont]|nr:hypothetical protein D1AOALGA4SA_480 [Olavius algarvensis Delta 1 endosymbiont]